MIERIKNAYLVLIGKLHVQNNNLKNIVVHDFKRYQPIRISSEAQFEVEYQDNFLNLVKKQLNNEISEKIKEFIEYKIENSYSPSTKKITASIYIQKREQL